MTSSSRSGFQPPSPPVVTEPVTLVAFALSGSPPVQPQLGVEATNIQVLNINWGETPSLNISNPGPLTFTDEGDGMATLTYSSAVTSFVAKYELSGTTILSLISTTATGWFIP